MADQLKHEIRSSILKWQLSVKSRDQKDELFIRDVFRELDGLMELIYEKHDGSFANKDCHKIMDVWPMTSKAIIKIHKSITRRLRATPSTSSPYFCQFSHDLPNEVFGIMKDNILERTSIGIVSSSTTVQTTIKVTDKRKAIYFFNYMNKETILIEKENLLRKEFEEKAFAEVVISDEKPMIFKYNNNSQILVISFHYGFWNTEGLPQH